MTSQNNSPSPQEAQQLLAQAESVGTAAISNHGWPAAMVFNSLAILGSLLMVGMHIVAHTGYGAPLLACSVGIWAAFTATTWSLMIRTTKLGFTKRFLSSLLSYMSLYVAALLIGVFTFPNGSLAYYITAAAILAAMGLAAAFRELRA
ncbi:hypothetical protein [Arthrobacter psychrolactophilus]